MTLLNHPASQKTVRQFVEGQFSIVLAAEITQLCDKNSGWHFSAQNADQSQIDAFSIREMASTLEVKAPSMWKLLGTLLASDPARASRRAHASRTTEHATPNITSQSQWNDEDEYWELDAERSDTVAEGDENEEAAEDRRRKRQRRAAERTPALHKIKQVTILSILMMSTNKRCNSLASIIGIFCHSTSTPELVVEMLAHMGLSISLSSIHQMVTSLSNKSHNKLREMGKTRLASFAYDNFDMDFKSWVPTIDKPGSTLKHATSGLAFPLNHGVVPDDLKCSAELWASDPFNIRIPPNLRQPQRTWMDCLPSPDTTTPDGTPSRQIRIIAWHFRHALVTLCDSFAHFRKDLGMPETILQIPVTKTSYVPCRSMDINQSTSDGQAQIIENICSQANIGDPTDHSEVTDIREHVGLWHGDLRTGELIELMRRSRSLESKEIRRMQFIIFVMGLFHLQMAAADSLWRMFIQPKELRLDPNGLYAQICKIRPNDSGRIASKPGFRLMHDIAHQCAYARILDCWHVEVKKRCSTHTSLEAFASSKPNWNTIIEISSYLATTYLDKPMDQNINFRNNSLILARLIQYLELTHAMKHGDIGRVEDTFLHWVFVFKATGKHKYATHLIKIMINMKFVFSERLKRAIRLNWLCNPTGKADGFRAIDWLVELLNLYTKIVYGSSGSTRTFQLILKHSPLIEIFRKIHLLIQNNFHLLHRSIRHAPPDIGKTIAVLREWLEKQQAHEKISDQTSHPLRDHYRDGMHILQTERRSEITNELAGGDEAEEIEMEDLDI